MATTSEFVSEVRELKEQYGGDWERHAGDIERELRNRYGDDYDAMVEDADSSIL